MSRYPPRLAERLLAAALGDHPAAPYVLADLREEFAALSAAHSRRAAWWYWWEAIGLGLRHALTRPRRKASASRSSNFGDLMRTDFVLALRSLTRRPAITAAIVLTIGGALAATSVAFSLVNGILLRPLPFGTPERLVSIWERFAERGADKNVVSPANYYAWRRELKLVEDLTAVFETSAALTGDGDPEQVGVVLSAGPLFSLLGGAPLVGRFYGAAEDVDGGPAVAVISEQLWRRRFGADPAVVGRTIIVNGTKREIIGVLPRRLDFAPVNSWGAVGSRDLYLPLQYGPAARSVTGRFLQVVARLAPGATLAAAGQEATALVDRLRVEFPDRLTGWGVNLVTLRSDLVGDVETPLAIVFAAVALVLLVACANVANLLMARATERRGELTVRAALGASRFDLARQVFGESMVLALLGGIVGVGLSVWGIAALVGAAPDLPRLDQLGVDGRLVGFLVLGTVVVAVAIGVGPAVESSGRDVGGWFTQRGAVGDRRANRARRVLVGVQVAFSLVLVVGAGLLVRSLANRLTIDLGFDPENVVTAQVSLRGEKYREASARGAAVEAVLERVAALPGIAIASGASSVPMSDKNQATSFVALDRPRPPAGQFPVADVRFVHHAYFAAMRIGVREGRSLAETDRPGVPLVVAINATGARQLWPNESAIGKRIEMEWGDTLRAEIVGVVDDVRLAGPDQPVERATLYWEYRQLGVPDLTLVVRGERGVPDVAPVRRALAEVDPNLPLYGVRSMEGLRADTVAQARFLTASLTLFSILALGLAALGVYGVMAYGVQQRSREIGVRLALGADRSAVVRMLLSEGARVVGPALAVGLVAALLLSRFLRGVVFGVTATDPVTVVGALLIIALVALGACWFPARRASAIPPAEAIRTD